MPTSPAPSRICSPLSEPHQTAARTPPNSATSSTFGDHSYLTPPARTGGAAGANTKPSTPTTASCSPVPLERRVVVAATAPSTTSTSKTCPPQMAPPPFRPPGLEKNMMVGPPPPGLLPSARVHAEEESGRVHQAEEDAVLQLLQNQSQKDEHRPPLPPPAEKNCQLSDIPAICARLGIKSDDSLLLKFNNKGTNFLKTRKFDPTRPMTKDYLKFLLKTYVKEHSDALKDEMTRLDLIQHFLGAIDATEWRQFLDSGNWRSSTREHQDEQQPDALEDGRNLQGGSAAVAGGGSTSFSQPTTPTGSEASVPILSVGGNPRVVSPLAAGEQTTASSSPTCVLKAGGSFQFHGPANSTDHLLPKRVSFLDHSDPSPLGGNDSAPAAQQQAVAANAKSPPPPRPAVLAAATTTSGPALRSSPPNKLGAQELSPAARTAKGSAAPHQGSSTTHRQAAAARQQALNLHASALVRAHGAAAHHQSALYVGTPQTPYGTPSHQQLHQADTTMMTGHHLANFAAQAQAQHHAAIAAQAQHQAAALSMAAAASHNQRGYNHLPGAGAASVMAAAMAAQSQQHHGAPAGFPAGVGAGGGYGGAALMGGYGGGSGGYNPYDAGHHPGAAAGGLYHHDLSTTVAGYPNVQATAGGWSQRYPGRGGSRRRGGRHSRGNKHVNTGDATLTAAGLATGTGPPRTE